MKVNNKKISMLLIFAIPFLMGLGIDMYVPSLPEITKYFNTTEMFIEWTVGLYMLGYGIGQLFFGPISDWKGRRKVILISAFLFSIVSGLIVIAPNVFILNILRFLQGISVAGLAVAIRAVLVDLFSKEELKKVSSYFSLSWSIGPIVGPFIGAHLENVFGWKANFYLFLVYGVIIYLYTAIFFKETNLNIEKLNGKVVKENIITMIRYKEFVFTVVISAIMYTLIIIFNIVGPFIIEKEMNKPVDFYGEVAMLLGTAYFLGVILNRFLISKVHEKKLILVGLIINLGITIVMVSINIFIQNLYTIIIPVYLIFLFIGLIVPNAILISMSIFKKNSGIASSLFGIINGISVFLISNIISIMDIKTGLLLSITYLVLIIIAIILKGNISNLKQKIES